MESTYRSPKSSKSQNQQKTNWFWKIFGGEFLISENIRKWYPYFILIFVLIGSIVISERSIKKKKMIIKKMEIEYREAIKSLKKNNKFIPYEQNQELIEILQKEGYKKNEQLMYKIIVEK